MELDNNQIKKDLEFIVDKNMDEAKENLMQSMQEYLENGKIKIQDCVSIDRIEGEIAVSELSNGQMLDIPINKFKEKITPGDIFDVQLIYNEGNIQTIVIQGKNEEEKNRRLESIREKLKQIKESNKNQ